MENKIVRGDMPLLILFVTLFLIFSGTSFADENPRINNFNTYVNSPEGNAEASVDKNTSPMQVTNKEVPEDSVKTDTKRSLQGIPSKDQTCTTDSDCTAGVVDCVSWEAFNKKYSQELFKNLSSCPASIDPGFQPVAACVAKVCKTTEKTTDVSWDDWLRER